MGGAKGLSLMSGGLDSQLAIRLLEHAGAQVEAIVFESPFFDSTSARKAATNLGIKLHVIDFLKDELGLIKNPPHGFGGAMNPCIDCHALMIKRAGELMNELGYDFVATGEVQGQRPMSQNRQSLAVVEKSSGMKGRLVRPLSAKLLEPTIPEIEGKINRDKLLDISGRGRERQIALAEEFGIVDYPSPAGGCKLTETGFCNKLKDLMDHEGFDELALVRLLPIGRRFRLKDGSSLLLGRDQRENAILRDYQRNSTVIEFSDLPGPTAMIPSLKSAEDLIVAHQIVKAWSRGGTGRERFKEYQLC